MRRDAARPEERNPIPKKGDRIELVQARAGVRRQGTVFHVDQLQILVKWDDGRSGNLEPDGDPFRIVVG
jgi:hypothetical protein